MTLEKLAQSSESCVAQALNIRAPAASQLLLAAKELYAMQSAKQHEQRQSLNIPGTTKEKAAHSKALYSLALEAADDNELSVASPE